MNRNVEMNVDEILRTDFGMDTNDGDEQIGKITSKAYRLFPDDFARALDWAEKERLDLASIDEFEEAGTSEVRDRMTETLRMFCETIPKYVAADGSVVIGGKEECESVWYRFAMALSPVETDVMISMIDADADNEHDKGEDDGLRAELGASLREKLVEISGTGGAVVMSPSEFDLIAMLTDNWFVTGGAECLRCGPDDFTEEQEQALIEETEKTLAALHGRLVPDGGLTVIL